AVGDGLMVDELPADALDIFVEVAGAHVLFPLVSIELRHLGGELRRQRREHGALASIEADYAMGAVGMVFAAQLEVPARIQVKAVKAAFALWVARHMYLGFVDTQQDTVTFWTDQVYNRLRRIKIAVDPDDLICSNHFVPPISSLP